VGVGQDGDSGNRDIFEMGQNFGNGDKIFYHVSLCW